MNEAMSCVKGAFALLTGPNACPAILLAVAAFVLGALAMCILCKLRHAACGSRGGKCKCGGAKPAARSASGAAAQVRKPHPPPADGSIEIYVGNLSYELTDDMLRKEFEAFGTVNSARIIFNRNTNKSKGYGFVHMPVRAEADAAVKALDGKEILGRKLRCNEAENVA